LSKEEISLSVAVADELAFGTWPGWHMRTGRQRIEHNSLAVLGAARSLLFSAFQFRGNQFLFIFKTVFDFYIP